jgi:hypothetical protein
MTFSDGYVSQRQMFDILMSVKVMANEAKSIILAVDPLVHNLFIDVGAVITLVVMVIV